MKFTLVLPFYNDIEKLIPTLQRVKREGKYNDVEEVLLCHNGQPLTLEQLNKLNPQVFEGVRILHTDTKGIGAGYKLGIQNAKCDFVILSASDLPFGWTDLNSFKKSPSDFVIGSKAHKDSVLEGVTFFRRFLSFGFFQLRRIILGFTTPGDSQGSFIVRTNLAQSLIKNSIFDNYLFSLELASLHLKTKGQISELPIQVENNEGESSVSVRSDSIQMFKDLIRLRRSLKI